MSLVLDASLALAWCFKDEATPETEALLNRVSEDGAVVPMLWRLEVANALRTAVKRGRVSKAYPAEVLAELARLPIIHDSETASQAWGETLDLAGRFDLTLYDAAYLELAGRRRLPLATLDEKLRQAAKKLGLLFGH